MGVNSSWLDNGWTLVALCCSYFNKSTLKSPRRKIHCWMPVDKPTMITVLVGLVISIKVGSK